MAANEVVRCLFTLPVFARFGGREHFSEERLYLELYATEQNTF